MLTRSVGKNNLRSSEVKKFLKVQIFEGRKACHRSTPCSTFSLRFVSAAPWWGKDARARWGSLLQSLCDFRRCRKEMELRRGTVLWAVSFYFPRKKSPPRRYSLSKKLDRIAESRRLNRTNVTVRVNKLCSANRSIACFSSQWLRNLFKIRFSFLHRRIDDERYTWLQTTASFNRFWKNWAIYFMKKIYIKCIYRTYVCKITLSWLVKIHYFRKFDFKSV